ARPVERPWFAAATSEGLGRSPLALLAACLLLCLPKAVSAQTLSVDLPNASLREALSQVRAQSGFEFALNLRQASEERRAAVHMDRVEVAEGLRQIGERFGCRFRSLDSSLLLVEAATPPPARSVPCGPYRVHFDPPGTTED